MKLTIFGATGRIGGHLLNWAVDAGHDVHVLARSPEALRPRDGLTVTGAMCSIRPRSRRSSRGPTPCCRPWARSRDNFHYTELLAPAAANIIDGMHKTGAHRLSETDQINLDIHRRLIRAHPPPGACPDAASAGQAGGDSTEVACTCRVPHVDRQLPTTAGIERKRVVAGLISEYWRAASRV
jgi:hypothetical protein